MLFRLLLNVGDLNVEWDAIGPEVILKLLQMCLTDHDVREIVERWIRPEVKLPVIVGQVQQYFILLHGGCLNSQHRRTEIE